MKDTDRKNRDAELDAFWDIDALIPKKRAAHYTHDTEATEIVIEAKSTTVPEESTPKASAQKIPPADPSRPKTRFIPPHTADEEARRPTPDEEYVPENPLIRRVRIYHPKSTYRYYEDFARNARKLHSVVGVECPRVPFFSYAPQYTQMSRAQLGWYLWWRESIRRGLYPDTDYSYLLLYLYELINLSDVIEPTEVQAKLTGIWLRYREVFRQLDTYLPEWICDHALIHRLPSPSALPAVRLSEMMSHCTLKEFYVPVNEKDVYIRALLTFCSNYDYRKSKFYVDERRELFDRTITGAIRMLTEHTGEDGKLFTALKMDDSRLAREAYAGAVCAVRLRRRIEVDFCSFSRSHELRYLVTDAIKYTENKLRAHLGIRSRLSIFALPTPVRDLLDAYTRDLLPAKRAQSAPAEPAPYEALYDLPRTELSLSRAAEIERLSWDTTERLVEAFEDDNAPDVLQNATHVTQKTTNAEQSFTHAMSKAPQKQTLSSVFPPPPTVETAAADKSAFSRYLPFLGAVNAQNASAQREAARKLSLPLDVLADEVNALAADAFGDILLEESDCGYAVIEDYQDLLTELLEQP